VLHTLWCIPPQQRAGYSGAQPARASFGECLRLTRGALKPVIPRIPASNSGTYTCDTPTAQTRNSPLLPWSTELLAMFHNFVYRTRRGDGNGRRDVTEVCVTTPP
ncbi:unnamed protein product, partial [Ectocarpus sp. 12 AP-2014]